MMTFNTGSRKDQGFTLVELAIVLIIIGLLIGGTLKGQELINGARVTATTAQIKALEAGTLTFQDTYNGFPGDIAAATTRLPNCTVAPCVVADTLAVKSLGDGRIDTGGAAATAVIPPTAGLVTATENMAYFNHLFNADLLDGLDGTATMNIGAGVLGAKLGSAKHYRIGYMASGVDSLDAATALAAGQLTRVTSVRPGHYLYLTSFTPGTAVAKATATTYQNASVTPSEAGRIDAKYDDGAPNTGNVLAVGTGAAAVAANICRAGGTAAGGGLGGDADSVYATANRQNDCGLYIRFSN